MRKHKLVAFEGIDGSGKSTQIKLLANKILENGSQVHSTCEPTNDYIGKIIREIFSHKREATQETIAGLFVADRLEHILAQNHGILTQLATGHVLTDRYYFSSYAYHGVHVDMDWVIEANAMAVHHGKADLHLFIDLSPEEAWKRIQKNRSHIEMYETLENLQKVRAQYLLAFDKLKDKENIVIINGNQSTASIGDEIYHHFSRL